MKDFQRPNHYNIASKGRIECEHLSVYNSGHFQTKVKFILFWAFNYSCCNIKFFWLAQHYAQAPPPLYTNWYGEECGVKSKELLTSSPFYRIAYIFHSYTSGEWRQINDFFWHNFSFWHYLFNCGKEDILMCVTFLLPVVPELVDEGMDKKELRSSSGIKRKHRAADSLMDVEMKDSSKRQLKVGEVSSWCT